MKHEIVAAAGDTVEIFWQCSTQTIAQLLVGPPVLPPAVPTLLVAAIDILEHELLTPEDLWADHVRKAVDLLKDAAAIVAGSALAGLAVPRVLAPGRGSGTVRSAAVSSSRPVDVWPIALNAAQEKAVKQWAADDRLWTTQETVEFNLRTFARMILKERTVDDAVQEGRP